MYKWKAEIQLLIKKNFTHKVKANYRGMMDQTYKGLSKKFN